MKYPNGKCFAMSQASMQKKVLLNNKSVSDYDDRMNSDCCKNITISHVLISIRLCFPCWQNIVVSTKFYGAVTSKVNVCNNRVFQFS